MSEEIRRNFVVFKKKLISRGEMAEFYYAYPSDQTSRNLTHTSDTFNFR